MGHGLRTVDQCPRPDGMSHGDHLLRRRDRAEGIRYLGQGHDFGAGTQQVGVSLQDHFAAVVDGRDQ